MDILIKIAQFILSFSLLVIIHEFGHYIFARIFGIRVEKFYLFFNPGFSLFKKKIGDTEYGIGWIPFGGYVKIAGMIDESMDLEQMQSEPKPDEFRSKPAWQRLLVMLGGVIMNIIFAVVIYIGLSWYYGDKYTANEDLQFGWTFNEMAQEIGFRNGDIILSVNGDVITDARMIFPAIAINTQPDVRILRGGEEMTITVPIEYVSRMLEMQDFMTPRVPFVVAGVPEETNAYAAGLMLGDSLVGINGVTALFHDEFVPILALNKGRTVELSLYRKADGAEEFLKIPVVVNEEGQLGVFYYNHNYYFPFRTRSYTFLESFPAGVKRTGTEISSYLKQMKLVFTPKTEAYKSIGGPIAIFQIFPTSWNWYSFWIFTALISVVLAVMNILPIPGLDGGHVMFVLYEMITGRKPGDKFLEYAQLAGLLILFSLIIFATGNDIYRFFIK